MATLRRLRLSTPITGQEPTVANFVRITGHLAAALPIQEGMVLKTPALAKQMDETNVSFLDLLPEVNLWIWSSGASAAWPPTHSASRLVEVTLDH